MIDLYCERIGPGLWGEPFNVVSSAAYLVAGLALLRLVSRSARRPVTARVIAWLPVAMALGSALFHAVAMPWARRFDEAPILAFEITVLVVYGRCVIRLPRPLVAVLVITFFALVAAARYGAAGLNGSWPYVPALVMAAAIASWHARHGTIERLTPAWGTAALGLGLVWRTTDLAVCGQLPIGTHCLWHVFTATAVYAFGRTVLLADRRTGD